MERKTLLYGREDETTHGVVSSPPMPVSACARPPPVPLSSAAEMGVTFPVCHFVNFKNRTIHKLYRQWLFPEHTVSYTQKRKHN